MSDTRTLKELLHLTLTAYLESDRRLLIGAVVRRAAEVADNHVLARETPGRAILVDAGLIEMTHNEAMESNDNE